MMMRRARKRRNRLHLQLKPSKSRKDKIPNRSVKVRFSYLLEVNKPKT